MAIEFSCPQCQQLVRTPLAAAGKKGRCPQCGVVVHIPALDTAKSQALRSAPAAAASSSSVSSSQISPAFVEFYCNECGQLVRTAAATAGKKGKCPNCKSLVNIPHRSAGSKSSAPPPPRHTPSRFTPTADLTPLEELQPLDVSPPPPPVHVTPRDLAPLLDEVLPSMVPPPAGALPPSAWTPAEPVTNPFASPAPTASWRKQIVDLGRRGLPWERDPTMETFIETVRYVLFAPGDAFLTMTRQGVGSPFGFFLVSSVASFLIGFFLNVIARLIIAGIMLLFSHPTDAIVIRWDALVVVLGGAACVVIFIGLCAGTIGNLINAVIFHACLMICGAANAGFVTTYRVVSFGMGSIMILSAVPFVGPLLALIMQPIVLTYGFMNAHETTGGRAFFAVILPWLFMLGLLTIVLLAFLPTILEAVKSAVPQTA